MSLLNPYACTECKMTFSSAKYLKVHVEVAHLSADSITNGKSTSEMKLEIEVQTKENETNAALIDRFDIKLTPHIRFYSQFLPFF